MTEPIGRRIALHRRRPGLSQAAVAGLVGRSESWLSQVERGLRGVDNHPVLRDLSRVLRVDISTLVEACSGADIAPVPPADQQLAAIERAVIAGPVGKEHVDAHRAVPDLHRAYQAARYDEVISDLPGLIAALEGA